MQLHVAQTPPNQIAFALLVWFHSVALDAVLALVDAARAQTVGANSGFLYIQELVNTETYFHSCSNGHRSSSP